MKNAIEIKALLRDWISTSGYFDFHDNDVLIDELCFYEKKNRADVVYANGKLTGFEIKSESDSLARWGKQHDAYLRLFDAVWLCCHHKHALKAIEQSERNVGILILDNYSQNVTILREAKDNKKIDKFEVISLLWRSELDELCVENNIKINRKERINEARRRVLSELHFDIIKCKVLSCIKNRYKGKDYSSSS
ncbi:sce7726 family protein [Proteus mirabilis]|uniref:sce7726 family protein n=1 Tax=Morganellaceae TaxID=1903414 RepID=UPI001A2FAFA8|nr:sce7726 family protein [Providencia sp. PROV187]MBI6502823.1 sce7726 family protein [Proteus mirabilis]HCT9442851.1 sce7726 family protein [Proteus mirabilis]HEJ9660647.1 sce7726 family protein [Proteus mirabilis]HEJ9739905.1 sce7726 family protein [Proteus mirabilis]HEK0639517.1 sce7726 family protein [Proteus mirabilis]